MGKLKTHRPLSFIIDNDIPYVFSSGVVMLAIQLRSIDNDFREVPFILIMRDSAYYTARVWDNVSSQAISDIPSNI